MNTLSAILIITGLFLLGASRIKTSIRMMVIQGMILGILPFIQNTGQMNVITVITGASSFIFKGILLPWLLFRALHQTAIRREIEPYIGFNVSILTGIIMLALSSGLAMQLLRSVDGHDPVFLSASFFMMLTGLFVVISRRKAITQVLGYLIMENGIYAIGIGIGSELHAFIELGVLLDVSVGVFLMGIMLFHINQEFDHIDSDKFIELSDYHRMVADREDISS